MGVSASKETKGQRGRPNVSRRSNAPGPNGTRLPSMSLIGKERKPSTEETQSLTFPGAAISVLYAYASQRGYYPNDPAKANQDSLCMLPFFGGDREQALFAVFDGHGEFGMHCAQFARDQVPENLQANLKLQVAPDVAFVRAMLQTNTQLHQQPCINDSMSGTTAVSVLIRGKTLYIANVGDSRCVLAERQDDKLVARDMTSDQTPFRRDECERVKRCGARVLTLEQLEGNMDPQVQDWGLEENNSGDPPRVWAQNSSYPGTAFTRSIGDSAAECVGVIAEPEVVSWQLTAANPFLVIASDGVWEFLSSQTVVNMVAMCDDPQQACLNIAAESARLWLQHEVRTDDITVIVVQFQFHDDSQQRILAGSARPSMDLGAGAHTSSPQQPLGMSRVQSGPGSGWDTPPTTITEGSLSLLEVQRELSMRLAQLPNGGRPSFELNSSPKPAALQRLSAQAMGSPPAVHLQRLSGPAVPSKHPTPGSAAALSQRALLLQGAASQLGVQASGASASALWSLSGSAGAAELVQRGPSSFSYMPAQAMVAPPASPPSFTAGLMPQLRSRAPGVSPLGAPAASPVASLPAPPAIAPQPTSPSLQALADWLQSHLLFAHLSQQQHKAVLALFEHHTVKAGDLIYEQGDTGDYFYVIASGQFEAREHQDDPAQATLVATYSHQPGATSSCFGELALLYSQPRSSTVTARTNGVLWSLQRSAYRQLMQQFDTAAALGLLTAGSTEGAAAAAAELQSLVQVLRSVEALQCLSDSWLYRLAAVMEQLTYVDGQFVIHEGDEGHDFCLLQAGSVVCTVCNSSGGASPRTSVEVLQLSAGQYFGERTLVAPARRAASAVAQGPVTLRRLSRARLEAVLGGKLQDVIASRERWQQALAVQNELLASQGSLPAWVEATKGGFALQDLVARGLLFSTDCSALVLMEHKESQDLFTVRVTSVADVVALGKQSLVLRAREITRSLPPTLSTPGVLHSYKDTTVLAEVLMASGLCTLDMLLAPTPLDDASAAFVAASVVLGLEHLAWCRVMYRGLSAHTLMVTEGGQVQLVDFRFARRNGGRAYTLCGNPEYLAPEVIEGRSHDETADLWALGVLIHDMLAGQTPFAAADDNELQIYSNILSGSREQTAHLSLPAADLVDRLLQKQPEQRLGAGPLGIAALKSHPWFANIDWQALSQHRLAPPPGLQQRVSDFEGVECAEFDPKPCAADTLWMNDF